MKSISFICLTLTIIFFGTHLPSTSVFEEFKISTASADVYAHTASSLKLESQSPTYQLKLEPNSQGKVVFSLGRHGYRSTLNVKNLAFGVHIRGFKDGNHVSPSFNLDDTYTNIAIDSNFVRFQQLFDPIPVYFNSEVDSVKLIFSNSHGLDVQQYVSIDDLKIMGAQDVEENPLLKSCEHTSIMFGIEGSSSIDKSERKTISKQLLALSKQPSTTLDSNQICIMEFGKNVHAMSESLVKKEIIKNIKSYKKGKNGHKVKTEYANWEAAFDRAIIRQPDIFIFITDRWSNYSNNGPTSFNGQLETLVSKCNTLKSNGTRLLFITSGLNDSGAENNSLYALLNQQDTREVVDMELASAINLRDVDLISLKDFEAMELIDLTTLLDCQTYAVAK